MECFRRAAAAEASPARNAELVLAMKSALTLSALTKALDGHRDAVCKNERANEEAKHRGSSRTKYQSDAGEPSLWSEDPLRRTVPRSRSGR